MTNKKGLSHDQLNKLKSLNDECLYDLPKGTTLYRVQKAGYPEGFNFRAPEADQQVRYDDPNMKLKSTYMALEPRQAFAEVFRRGDEPTKFMDHDELERHAVTRCILKKDVKLLRISNALPVLGLKRDAITSSEYTLTQSITSYYSDSHDRNVDGIIYESRHYGDGSKCLVLWSELDGRELLETKDQVTLNNFVEEGSGVSGEDILRTLGVEVL